MKLRNRLKQSCQAEQVSSKRNPIIDGDYNDGDDLSSIRRSSNRMTPKSRDIFIRSKSATHLLALIAILAATIVSSMNCRLANAQYSGGGGYNYNQYESGGGGHESNGFDSSEMDERPKVKLGIRLRIPAFKFELPRFSLPKITVSAKIRQPEGPRVITLPEINLDTSSKVEQPNSAQAAGKGVTGGGQYGGDYSTAATNHRQPSSSYGHTNQGTSQVFSFSTGEETHAPSPSSARYQANGNRYYAPASRPMQMTNYQQTRLQGYGMRDQGSGPSGQYGATYPRHSYTSYNRPMGQGGTAYYQHMGLQKTSPASTSASYDFAAGKNNPDLGFNSPVYVDPQAVASNTVRNYKINPKLVQ